MKIQYQTRRFYPDLHGGAEVIGYEVVRCWKNLGLDVSVVAENYGKDKLLYDEPIDSVRCTRIPTGGLGIFWRINSLARLARWMWHQKDIKPQADIIVGSNPECIVASKVVFPGRPAIYRCEGITRFYFPVLNRRYSYIFGFIEKLAMSLSDAIIVPSHIVEKQLITYLGRRPKRLYIVPYGIDADRFIKAEPDPLLLKYKNRGDFIILSVGRLTQEKGMDFLIEVFSRMKNRSRVRLVIVGDGPQMEDLTLLARRRGLSERVVFTGRIGFPEKFFKAADLHVLLSRYETFGLVHLEAMACGVPTVSWRGRFPDPLVGSSEFILDGKTGFCIEPYNIDLLADKLDMLVEDRRLVKKMGVCAREYVLANFSWERTATEYLKIIAELSGYSFIDFVGAVRCERKAV